MTAKRQLTPQDLYHLRLISDPQIAPDGRHVAFVLRQMDRETNDYVGNIYVVDRDGVLKQFTSGGKDWGPRWSPDGQWLAFLSGRKEKAQIHLMSTSGGESTALTDRKLGAGIPIWSPDSTRLAFTGPTSTDPPDGEEEKDGTPGTAKTKIVERTLYKLDGAGYIGHLRRHLFLIDVASRTVSQRTEGDSHNDNPAWSPDGQYLAFSSNRSSDWDISRESHIYVVPWKQGDPEALTSGGQYSHPVFSPDGHRVAFVGHEDVQELFAPARLYSIDRADGHLRMESEGWDANLSYDIVSDIVLSAEPQAVTLFWRQDGIYFLGTERGESSVYRAVDGQVTNMVPGIHVISDFSLADDGTIAYACADATHPSEIFIQGHGEGTRLTRENDAFLDNVLILTPERIRFVGAYGERSEGWLLPPIGYESGTHPLIVYIHGGPMLTHGEALSFEYQLLAGQGFGVFYPNVHGSSSYGRDYQLSIRENWGGPDYQDVLAGLNAVMTREWIDASRVGIAGGSYGGYMSSWALGHGRQFRAGVIERCVSNLVSFMGTSDMGWIWDSQFGVYPEQDVQKLWDMSPMKYVEAITAPALVIHYERDDRTPMEQGEQIFNALRRLGRRPRFMIIPEESHGLTRQGKPSRRVERLEAILDWFRERL